MANKFNMSLEDNIFLAKRNLVDSIWKEANIEGIGVTFPETKEIFEGRTVRGLSVDDTIAINNLKHGWQFILENLDAPVDLAFVRQVNMLVGQGIVNGAGDLRLFDVGIGGTRWKPEIPDFDQASAMVSGIASREPGQDRALDMFAALCRAQLFSDGNKRTAQLVANKMLIASGNGILAIPVEEKAEFEALLIEFYETGDSKRFHAFLVDKGLDGIAIPEGKAMPAGQPTLHHRSKAKSPAGASQAAERAAQARSRGASGPNGPNRGR